jgi:DNA helicase-2/ATP-dependent DNA helicase PcrA
MGFLADLHVHSKYSRATSRDADLEHMALWALRKGVSVLGTGDFTHPAWWREIETKLVPAEPGLFRITPELERIAVDAAGVADPGPLRFLLEVEISTIYKKGDRVRKVHHLLYAPDLAAARRISERLSRIGNIASDGRPILGLDSRDLLEITLEAGEGCYLVPAHIWTPWFAALGSKSGFDSIAECYGDLAHHIFAVETGLSSDPPMNRRLSILDGYTLVSNSDAHSPGKIGREACVFDTPLDYFSMRRALETGIGYDGSVEFFAEEGKYHHDGHRNCGVSFEPRETREHGGLCPVCSRPLTLGVLHRVSELADREEPDASAAGPRAARFRSLVPLDEVLGEIERVGPASKTVKERYGRLIGRLGSELSILENVPLDEIARSASSLLAEGIGRMREGRVLRQAGYDGEYGTIRLFSDDELARGSRSQAFLFELGDVDAPKDPGIPRRASHSSRKAAQAGTLAEIETPRTKESFPDGAWESKSMEASTTRVEGDSSPAASLLDALDAEQRDAAATTDRPVVVIAGPGTGKTRTLAYAIAHLIAERGVHPSSCLAITFTRRAAKELSHRIEEILGDSACGDSARGDSACGDSACGVSVLTLHAFGHAVLTEHAMALGLPSPLVIATDRDREAWLRGRLGISERSARSLCARISRRRREAAIEALEPSGTARHCAAEPALGRNSAADGSILDLERDLAGYEDELAARGAIDLDDLILRPLALIAGDPAAAARYRARFTHIAIDEFQDVDRAQYELVKRIADPDAGLFVIGDPDQSIYGFRGADPTCFERLQEDFPRARRVVLSRNYRSARSIVDAATTMISPSSLVRDRSLVAGFDGPRVEIHRAASERAEAEIVVHAIERAIGGSSFFSIDSGRVSSNEGESVGFGDFAVLYRTSSQADTLSEAFARSGIPFQQRSHERLADVPSVQELIGEVRGILLERISVPRGDASSARRLSGLSGSEALEVAASRVRERTTDIDRFLPVLRALAESARDAEELVDMLLVGVDADLWDARAEAVSLLTLHAAKGLEFSVVFIVGCEDGLLPLRFGPNADVDSAEERRLFFVGMTRARRRLILLHAARRATRGEVRDSQRSPFLDSIRMDLLEHVENARPPIERAAHRQLTFF